MSSPRSWNSWMLVVIVFPLVKLETNRMSIHNVWLCWYVHEIYNEECSPSKIGSNVQFSRLLIFVHFFLTNILVWKGDFLQHAWTRRSLFYVVIFLETVLRGLSLAILDRRITRTGTVYVRRLFGLIEKAAEGALNAMREWADDCCRHNLMREVEWAQRHAELLSWRD